MDDGWMVTVDGGAEQGWALVSFSYLAGAAEETDAGTVIKKGDALLDWSAGLETRREIRTNGRPAHSITAQEKIIIGD
jgi:hypothetical protein